VKLLRGARKHGLGREKVGEDLEGVSPPSAGIRGSTALNFFENFLFESVASRCVLDKKIAPEHWRETSKQNIGLFQSRATRPKSRIIGKSEI